MPHKSIFPLFVSTACGQAVSIQVGGSYDHLAPGTPDKCNKSFFIFLRNKISQIHKAANKHVPNNLAMNKVTKRIIGVQTFKPFYSETILLHSYLTATVITSPAVKLARVLAIGQQTPVNSYLRPWIQWVLGF